MWQISEPFEKYAIKICGTLKTGWKIVTGDDRLRILTWPFMHTHGRARTSSEAAEEVHRALPMSPRSFFPIWRQYWRGSA
jgi:hypothetical protein